MADIFGHKWIASYGAEPSETWLAGLIDMSEEEIRSGLVACLKWREDWPPTLPQFRTLCRPVQTKAHRQYLSLPEPKRAREARKIAGLAAIANLREESRYRDWLQSNNGREVSPVDLLLKEVLLRVMTA